MAGCCANPWTCRTSAPSASRSRNPGRPWRETSAVLGNFMREVMRLNMRNFRRLRAGRDAVQPAARPLRGHQEGMARRVFPGGRRRRQPGPGRARHGDAQRAHPGRVAGGLHPERPARPDQQLRVVHPRHRLDGQPARQVAGEVQRAAVAGEGLLAQYADQRRWSGARTTTASRTRTPASSTWWRTRARAWCASTCRPTPTACSRSATTACAARTTSTSSSRTSSRRHAVPGHGGGDRALHQGHGHLGTGSATTQGDEPDVVMASCGDMPTLESWRPPPCCGSTSPTSRSGSSTWWICSS